MERVKDEVVELPETLKSRLMEFYQQEEPLISRLREIQKFKDEESAIVNRIRGIREQLWGAVREETDLDLDGQVFRISFESGSPVMVCKGPKKNPFEEIMQSIMDRQMERQSECKDCCCQTETV